MGLFINHPLGGAGINHVQQSAVVGLDFQDLHPCGTGCRENVILSVQDLRAPQDSHDSHEEDSDPQACHKSEVSADVSTHMSHGFAWIIARRCS